MRVVNIEKKKYYMDVGFVKIEKLKGRAKQAADAAGLKSGNGILRVSVNSPPVYEIEKFEGSPFNKLLAVGAEEGITQDVLNEALSE